jgi:hypothetical protein
LVFDSPKNVVFGKCFNISYFSLSLDSSKKHCFNLVPNLKNLGLKHSVFGTGGPKFEKFGINMVSPFPKLKILG